MTQTAICLAERNIVVNFEMLQAELLILYLTALWNCVVKLQRNHNENEHLLVFEGNGFTYLTVPPLLSSPSAEDKKLCFTDHRSEAWDPLSDICCLRDPGHVHAHVHHGEITEDILLEQCMEEAGCALPMAWELGSVLTPVSTCVEESGPHEHEEGCGHNKIAHGDHYDWLIPLKDGSYVLSHAQETVEGPSQFIEHGRLVKVGESLGQLKRRQPKQLVDLFIYEGPKRKGYESIPTAPVDPIVEKDSGCISLASPRAPPAAPNEIIQMSIPRGFKGPGMTKTTFDVMGICCPSEIPLIKKILEPLAGVEEVSVNTTSKTVVVLHDPAIVADVQIVKVLNEARLDATIHQRGVRRMTHKWPSPWTIGSGLLICVAFFHYLWSPLKWVALGSVAVAVPPIVVRSFVALRRFVLDINCLMLIAVGGAIALGDYLEAGSIAFLFTLADWLESRSSDKAREAISTVADLAPRSAVLMDGHKVAVEDVSIGTLLAVKAGELIPIDGEVVSGKSSVDESNITGESRPIEKAEGALVWAGAVNLSGYLTVRTTALAEDSAVSRMVRLVEDAQTQHSRTEQLVEKIAKYYTPVIVVSAVLVAAIPWAVHAHNPKHWVYFALVLLVVACPCALVISTPVVTTCGIAQAARAGLLVRGGSYLEMLGKIKKIAMDKTGTLTEGHFRVLNVHAVGNSADVEKRILYWIACVENKSSHPLAPALVGYARLSGVEPTGDVTDFEIISGEGVSAVVDGHSVKIGNARLASRCAAFEDTQSQAMIEQWSSQGATVGWVVVNERVLGIFGVADSLRPEAVEAVTSLKKMGVQVVMLTGDSEAAAAAVHNKLGDIEVHSQLLPEDKVNLVKELKTHGVTAMIGDGINDAPALAVADIGVAMGVAGSAVAMETADVALMTNDLRKLAVAIQLGNSCRWKIIQNVSLSFFTKLTIIVIAAAGYPSLWAAVLADVGTCLVVIFNSMRLLNWKRGVVLPKFESKGKHHHLQSHAHHHHVLDEHHHHHVLEEHHDCQHTEAGNQDADDIKTYDCNQSNDSSHHDHGGRGHHGHHHHLRVPCWPRRQHNREKKERSCSSRKCCKGRSSRAMPKDSCGQETGNGLNVMCNAECASQCTGAASDTKSTVGCRVDKKVHNDMRNTSNYEDCCSGGDRDPARSCCTEVTNRRHEHSHSHGKKQEPLSLQATCSEENGGVHICSGKESVICLSRLVRRSLNCCSAAHSGSHRSCNDGSYQPPEKVLPGTSV
ncbi:hypothetical protein R1sor_003669 [Riccia sorocarpa]|uniref:HMA domain-containing protein n=1 Tax=Riccia sorocarpa TaxID=122646 RepID=A0ABD3H519_9MARC